MNGKQSEHWSVVFVLFLYGLAISIHCIVMWGSVIYVVPQETLGVALGILISLKNLSLALLVPLIQYFSNLSGAANLGYFWVEILFILLSLISMWSVYSLYQMDLKQRGGLL